ncbi:MULTISPECIES: hypothetical protein [Streptomyces]|uniref:hypothetical protein n=1 Tax=Streptomyces TaxID=1883 RepID=UPI002E14C3F9|nr:MULTISPECIES: hypothetical protein [unclassified Streptomyces]
MAEIVGGYEQAGVERIVFPLDTEAPDPLQDLDDLAALTAGPAADRAGSPAGARSDSVGTDGAA